MKKRLIITAWIVGTAWLATIPLFVGFYIGKSYAKIYKQEEDLNFERSLNRETAYHLSNLSKELKMAKLEKFKQYEVTTKETHEPNH